MSRDLILPFCGIEYEEVPSSVTKSGWNIDSGTDTGPFTFLNLIGRYPCSIQKGLEVYRTFCRRWWRATFFFYFPNSIFWKPC